MPNYTVQRGDTLAKIAEAFGLTSWKSIYNHGNNANFRKKRPNPNLIYPGDVVFVPTREDRIEAASTDQRHKYIHHRPDQVLRIAAEDMDGRRLAKLPYELMIDSDFRQGTTDAQGMLEEEIRVNAGQATLKIGDYKWSLEIGALNPIEETPDNGISGAQGRLANLGYPIGPIDGICGPKTRAALRYFQADESLPVSGELDDATRRKLLDVHGI